jgi:predicted nucleic acid-binding protein
MSFMTGLDTNILIYACAEADFAKQDRAVQLIRQVKDAVILWQVACEFVSASRKLEHQGFTPDDAWNRLGELITIFPLVQPTPGVLERARDLHTRRGWSFWDATLVGACLEAKVTRLYSEDLPGQSVAGLEIVNPFS